MANDIIGANKKLIIFVSGCLIFLYVYFGLILKYQFTALRSLNTQIRAKSALLSSYKNGLNDIRVLEEKSASAEIMIARLKGQFIPDTEVSLFMDNISSRARARGIKIMQMIPKRDAVLEAKNIRLVAGVKLVPVAIDMELHSGYHQAGELINGMENDFLAGVVSLDIKSDPKDPLFNIINLTIEAYVTKK